MTAMVFTDIQTCLGNNAETLYNPGAPITDSWFTSGFIDMGTRPNGDNTSSNWTPDNTSYKSAGFWNAIQPWGVIYPGVSHTATNTRVEISKFTCMVYSLSQKNWVDLTSNDTKIPTSENSYNFNLLTISGAADSRVEASGNVSYKLNGSKNPIKFSLNAKRIYGDDVGGVFITCTAKLVLDNGGGTDDRASAHLLISVGADYLPSITNVESDFYPEQSPKVCGSKFSLITNTDKVFYAVPLNPPGVTDTSSTFSGTGGRAHIDFEWFKRNFPKSFFSRNVFADAEFNYKLTNSLALDVGSGTPTFSRASVATVFDHEGTLQTVPSGVARFSGGRLIRNLFTRSEGFEVANTPWSKTNMTVTTGFTDSLGGTKARKIIVTTGATNNIQSQSNVGPQAYNAQNGFERCNSFEFKKDNWDNYVFILTTGTKVIQQWFNAATGVLGTRNITGSAPQPTVTQAKTTSLGNGWFRFEMTAKFNVGDTYLFKISACNSDGVTTPSSTAGASLLIAFAQCEVMDGVSVKTFSNYVSSGEITSPWHGAGADSCKWFTTDRNGIAIPKSTLLGYQWNSINKTNVILYNRDIRTGAENGKWIPTTTGSELVTNGTFTSNTTGWTASNCTLTSTSSRCVMAATADNAYMTQSITTVIGSTYLVSLDVVTDGMTGVNSIKVGTTAGGSEVLSYTSAVGTNKFCFVATATTTYLSLSGLTGITGQSITVDNFSCFKSTIDPLTTQTGIDKIALSCSLLTASTTNGIILQATTNIVNKRTTSAYIKRSVGTGSVFITRDGGTTWVDITSQINSSTFTRVKIEESSVLNPSIGFKIATSGDAIIVDYVQDEEGSISMPIYTTTVAATRLLDSLTCPTGNISDTEGTILATVTRDDWTKNNGAIIGDYNKGITIDPDTKRQVIKDGSNNPKQGTKKFNPGHYYAALYNSARQVSNYASMLSEVTSNAYFMGIEFKYSWRELETSQDVYDFSDIRNKFRDLKTINKRMILRLDLKTGLNGSGVAIDVVPDYIKSGGAYSGGQWRWKNSTYPSGSGYNINLWDSDVTDRFKLLIDKLSAEFDNEIYFEAIGFSATGFDDPVDSLLADVDGTLKEPYITNYFTALADLNLYTSNKFKKTICFQNIDFPRSRLTSYVPNMITNGISLGYPNLLQDEPTLNGVASGSDGAYEYADSAKGVVATFCSVQSSDYGYTNLAGTGGSIPTIPSLFKYARVTLSATHLLWNRANTTVKNNILTLFAGFPDQSTPGDLIFSTKFAPGISIASPSMTNTTNAQCDFGGKDSETGYSFPVGGIVNSNSSGVLIIARETVDLTTIGNHGKAEIVQTTDNDGNIINMGLCSLLLKQPIGTANAQVSTMINRTASGNSDLTDMYVKWDFFQGSEIFTTLHPEISAGNTRTFVEWKSGGYAGVDYDGDFRLGVRIVMDDAKVAPYFELHTSNHAANGTGVKAIPGWVFPLDYHVEDNLTFPIPIDEWFTAEWYWHKADAPNGRAFLAVNGETVFDYYGKVNGDLNLKVTRIFWANAYTGGDVPCYTKIANVEMWTHFPLDTAGKLLKKLPSKYYLPSISSGRSNLSVSWIGNQMHSSVDGVQTSDSKYDGSMNLTTFQIGNMSSGYMRDLYIWKNALSDEEKLQISAKEGITKHKQLSA